MTGSERLDCVEINSPARPSSTIIWLHGLGADGHDFEPIVPELRLPTTMPVRFVFPHAPLRPVTINAGMPMRAWYDVSDVPGFTHAALDDFLESVDHLRDLIAYEMQSGMPSKRILVAGFSQGGAVALHAGLTYEHPLAGILALSTYLPTEGTIHAQVTEVNGQIPIMMAHGTTDPTIPMSHAIRTKQTLVRLGYNVAWHEYPMMHGVCTEEIRDIRAWLLETLSPSSASPSMSPSPAETP